MLPNFYGAALHQKISIAHATIFDEHRLATQSSMNRKSVNREILLALWKIYILHHAAEDADGVVGNWWLKELRHHGYEVSPGTLYPMLARGERFGGRSPTGQPDGTTRLSAGATSSSWRAARCSRRSGGSSPNCVGKRS